MPERGAWLLERRWAPQIVLALADGPKRFNRLLEGIAGINDRMLFVRLQELEVEGLLNREVDSGRPVRVHYGLTAAGRRYLKPLAEIEELEAAAVSSSAVAS